MQATVALFPGDGIGGEVIAQARECLDLCAQRIGLRLTWVEGCSGGAAIDRCGVANPLAAILSGAMLLRHSLACADAATALETAPSRVIAAGWRTADIREPGARLVGCGEMGALVRRELEQVLA